MILSGSRFRGQGSGVRGQGSGSAENCATELVITDPRPLTPDPCIKIPFATDFAVLYLRLAASQIYALIDRNEALTGEGLIVRVGNLSPTHTAADAPFL